MIEMIGEVTEIAEAESPLAKLAEDTDVPSSEELDELIEKAESSGHMLDTRETGDAMPDDGGEGVAQETDSIVSEEGQENAVEDVGEAVSADAGEDNPDFANDEPIDGPSEDATEVVIEKHRCPRSGGKWEGPEGDSTFVPDDNVIPNNRNYSNPDGLTWAEIKEKYGVDGVTFKDGYPDFSEVSKGSVEIDNFTTERYGSGGNFDQADKKLAEQRGCTAEEVRQWRIDNNYTWHEMQDCKTMQKVPREVHGNIPHDGGISKLKNAQ